MSELQNIPPSIAGRIALDSIEDLGNTRLGGRLLFVRDKIGGDAVLKIGFDDEAADLIKEAELLSWIGTRLPVPMVLEFLKANNSVYLLRTRLSGSPAHDPRGAAYGTAVKVFAEALRKVHGLSFQNCPFTSLLGLELGESERTLRVGLLNYDAFLGDVGQSPENVFEYLVRRRSIIQEDTFTHGDFCLPNVLLSDSKLSGIIDWGAAGVSDRHRDFMFVEMTIRRNFGEDWIRVFYDYYGIGDVDKEKIRYYWLLNRFVAHERKP